jgi:hypothetical protein
MDPTSYLQLPPAVRARHAAQRQTVADLEQKITEMGFPVGKNANHSQKMMYSLFSNACKSIRHLPVQAIRTRYNENPTFYPLPYGFVDLRSYKEPQTILQEKGALRFLVEDKTRMITQRIARETAQGNFSPQHMQPHYAELYQLQAKSDALETSHASYLMQFRPIDMPSYYVSMLPIIDEYEAALFELREQDFFNARLASVSFRSEQIPQAPQASRIQQAPQIPQLQAYNQAFGLAPTAAHDDENAADTATATDNAPAPVDDIDLAIYHLFHTPATIPDGPSP